MTHELETRPGEMPSTETKAHAPDGTWYADALPRLPNASQLTVVLLHGVGLDLDMWDAQAEALSEHYRVLRYDMYGHGNSPSLPHQSSLQDYCKQLSDLLEYRGIQTVVPVGFSMGGVIAQRFAADNPGRLGGIVLMSTVYRRTQAELAGVRERLKVTEQNGIGDVIDLAVTRWLPEQFQAQHPEAVTWLRGKMGQNDRRGYTDAYRVFVQADADVGDALTQVRCPALVITGGDDVGSTPTIAERMAADLDDAKLVVLDGLRHMVTMQDSERVTGLLADFLSSVSDSN